MLNGSAVNINQVNGAYSTALYLLSDSLFSVSTDGSNTLVTSLGGSSDYTMSETSLVTAKAELGGGSSYSVDSYGNNWLVSLLEPVASYDYTTTGSSRLVAVVAGGDTVYSLESNALVTAAASMVGDISYTAEVYGRANVVKYSQEVLEEFACVAYNVEMVDNVFRVSPIENSVTADATIVFEVNKC